MALLAIYYFLLTSFGLCLPVGAVQTNKTELLRSDKPQLASWQPNPDCRGTSNIILSCAFTILACTWTIQHLNLLAGQDIKIVQLARKCGWMIFNIILPEFLLAQAIFELNWAHKTPIMLRAQKLGSADTDAEKSSLHSLMSWLRNFF